MVAPGMEVFSAEAMEKLLVVREGAVSIAAGDAVSGAPKEAQCAAMASTVAAMMVNVVQCIRDERSEASPGWRKASRGRGRTLPTVIISAGRWETSMELGNVDRAQTETWPVRRSAAGSIDLGNAVQLIRVSDLKPPTNHDGTVTVLGQGKGGASDDTYRTWDRLLLRSHRADPPTRKSNEKR